jgi:hypothetical protein
MSNAIVGGATGAAPTQTRDPFPRGTGLPTQSPLYWIAEKDRYLRQLLIRDIQAVTGRTLLVYFAAYDQRAQISPGDDAYFSEMLRDVKSGTADLLIETAGGFTDATEKIASILRQHLTDLRVVVPCRAKSNGTILALVGNSIVMGPCSELGPADPLIQLAPNNAVPAHYVIGAANADPIFQQAAHDAIKQTKKLATSLLETGMMNGKTSAEVEATVSALSSRSHYHSHGSVIDADEAERINLKVVKLAATDELWQRFWLLRCMYDHDSKSSQTLKFFEGPAISNRLRAANP